ncbi:MAG: hypothetical protein AAF231_05760 [Pseudomonadota bacterium]
MGQIQTGDAPQKGYALGGQAHMLHVQTLCPMEGETTCWAIRQVMVLVV